MRTVYVIKKLCNAHYKIFIITATRFPICFSWSDKCNLFSTRRGAGYGDQMFGRSPTIHCIWNICGNFCIGYILIVPRQRNLIIIMRIIIIIRPFQWISTVYFRCICWLRTINTKQSNNTEYGNYFYPATFFQANHPFFSNHVHIWDRKCCMGLPSVSVIYLNFPILVYHMCRNLSTINDQNFSTNMKYLFIKYIRKLIDLDIKGQLFRILSENSDRLFPESAAIAFPFHKKTKPGTPKLRFWIEINSYDPAPPASDQNSAARAAARNRYCAAQTTRAMPEQRMNCRDVR